MESLWQDFTSFLKTLLCFIVALMLVPLLVISFLCAHFANELGNYLLSISYPYLTISKSKKIRTLIDTPKNAGIFHFLLEVEGPCDFERIKRAYAVQLIELKDKTGMIKFPKLRQRLVSCWGQYAWVNDTSGFNINNHVLLGTQYRGRPVNKSNLQEYISDLTGKYMLSDLPQWQVTVIPNSESTQPYYILVKLHHLILAEEEELHVGEMLLLQDNERKSILELNRPSATKQLTHFVRQPEHISKLLNHLLHVVSCRWQQFIYEFESLETPDGIKSHPDARNLTQLLSLALIVVVNVGLGYWRTRSTRRRRQRKSTGYRNGLGLLQTLYLLMHHELEQRNLSWAVAQSALAYSLQPSNIIKAWTRFLWQLLLHHLILFPYYVYCEMLALRDVLLRGQTALSATYCARLHLYVPLLFYAQLELVKICYELFKAPRNIYEVLFVQPTKELNILHKVSYCGRKIVSFSRSIDGAVLRERHQHLFDQKLRESDFSLSCLAGAVHDYFNTYAEEAKVPVPVPVLLNTTCRTISKGYFTDRSGDKSEHIGGVVFLQLPLGSPDARKAQQLHEIVERIRKQQIIIYLASIGQTKYSLITALLPQVVTKIFINFFSYNFPVTITEIYGAADTQFQSAWGQRVHDVLLFRPPQSKTGLSLNLHRFGDKYRLAVMADTNLGPYHTQLTQSFERYMETVTL